MSQQTYTPRKAPASMESVSLSIGLHRGSVRKETDSQSRLDPSPSQKLTSLVEGSSSSSSMFRNRPLLPPSITSTSTSGESSLSRLSSSLSTSTRSLSSSGGFRTESASSIFREMRHSIEESRHRRDVGMLQSRELKSSPQRGVTFSSSEAPEVPTGSISSTRVVRGQGVTESGVSWEDLSSSRQAAERNPSNHSAPLSLFSDRTVPEESLEVVQRSYVSHSLQAQRLARSPAPQTPFKSIVRSASVKTPSRSAHSPEDSISWFELRRKEHADLLAVYNSGPVDLRTPVSTASKKSDSLENAPSSGEAVSISSLTWTPARERIARVLSREFMQRFHPECSQLSSYSQEISSSVASHPGLESTSNIRSQKDESSALISRFSQRSNFSEHSSSHRDLSKFDDISPALDVLPPPRVSEYPKQVQKSRKTDSPTVTKTIEHFRAEQERLLHEIEDLKREETTLSARLSATQHDSSELDRAFQDLDTISMTTIPTFSRILHSPGKDAKVGFLSGTSSPFGQRFRVGPMPMNYLGSILEYAALGGERSNFLDGVPTSFTGSTLASVPNSSSRLQLDYAEFAHSQLSDSRMHLRQQGHEENARANRSDRTRSIAEDPSLLWSGSENSVSSLEKRFGASLEVVRDVGAGKLSSVVRSKASSSNSSSVGRAVVEDRFSHSEDSDRLRLSDLSSYPKHASSELDQEDRLTALIRAAEEHSKSDSPDTSGVADRQHSADDDLVLWSAEEDRFSGSDRN